MIHIFRPLSLSFFFRSETNRYRSIRTVVIAGLMTLWSAPAFAQAPAPNLAAVSPAGGFQGSTINLTLNGEGFSTQSTVVFSDPAIILQSLRLVSPALIEATVVLSARPGTYALRVMDADGASGLQEFSIMPTMLESGAELNIVPFAAAEATSLGEPYKAWSDATDMYVTEYAYSAVSRINLLTGDVTTLAGKKDGFGTLDGFGEQARFGQPAGIWSNRDSVFVTDAYFDTVRRISLTTGEVTTVAGSPDAQSGADDGVGTNARFHSPNGIWGDGTHLYICDRLNFTIRKIDMATGEVTTLAGSPRSRGEVDGIGPAAQFYAPTDIWGDGVYLYIADGNAIRRVVIATGEVETMAGEASYPAYADGPGATARFSFIGGIWADGMNLFVADTGNDVMRKVSLLDGTVSTMAGLPMTPGNNNGPASEATFHGPTDVSGDGTRVHIVDSRNLAIRQALPR